MSTSIWLFYFAVTLFSPIVGMQSLEEDNSEMSSKCSRNLLLPPEANINLEAVEDLTSLEMGSPTVMDQSRMIPLKQDSNMSFLSEIDRLGCSQTMHQNHIGLPREDTSHVSHHVTFASMVIEHSSINDTVVTITDQKVYYYFISLEQVLAMLKYMQRLVNPTIGIIGLLGNIFSGIVLCRSGLHKPSNILLFTLTIADSCCLIGGAFNIPMMLWKWTYPYTTAFVCFVFFVFLAVLGEFGFRMSASVTALITAERLLAVFMPIRFHLLVTRRRIWGMIGLVFTVWLSWMIWYSFQFQFVYNGVYGDLRSDFLKDYEYVNRIIDHALILAFVITGSIAISIKVSITQGRRRQMTKQYSSSTLRTTKMLLMVCLVFSFTKVNYLLRYLPIFQTYDAPWLTVRVAYELLNLSITLFNSAANFFIYVVSNPNFRKILQDLYQST